MVYGIIKQNNGYINVYSEPGQGTTFKIYLPLISEKAEELKPEVIQPVERGTETVLLAEDAPDVRVFTKMYLEELGYKVIEAVDGEDAISKFTLDKDKIQIVLLDVIMPKKNGKEVYYEIKKIRPDIKALFMSGYTADVMSKQGIIEKGFKFILKPFSPTKLSEKIREVLKNGV
jgi:DNA-binding NtrC family response regulator